VSDRIATTEARPEGFYWVILGHNPPEIAYWERGEWWLAGDPKPWQPEAVTVASGRLVFKRQRDAEVNAVLTARRERGRQERDAWSPTHEISRTRKV
jgi:hypothetical protein